MRKVYLDFGGNKGQGLRHFINKYGINPTEWVVETYEPDPNCYIEEHIKDLDFVIINNKAVWTHTGTIQFSQMLENTEGSSVECLMSEGACSDQSSDAYRFHNSIIERECVDISEILEKYKDSDFIVVKMDIEGSEFNVLRKILSDGTINYIDHMYIEWHHVYVKNENNDTVNILKNEIKKHNIQLDEWH